MMKVDAVITWVDGNDSVLNEKRNRYGNDGLFKTELIAGKTRYANDGEIFWCVASLNRFAPWINKIYIVTDGQDPNLTTFLEKHFPDGYIPVEVVDHKVIFRDYEEYLPVFNSISIETMTWRIPGLSEHYICLNDDFMLTAPADPADFFTDDGVVAMVSWESVPWIRLKQLFKPRKNGKSSFSFRWTMVQAASILGERVKFMRLGHSPRGLLRSFSETFYAEHPELILRNIRHKFRDSEQFSDVELQYLALFRQGRCKVLSPKDYSYCIYPKKGKDYIKVRMEKLEHGNYKCCCFNSLDRATPEDMKLIKTWINKTLGL